MFLWVASFSRGFGGIKKLIIGVGFRRLSSKAPFTPCCRAVLPCLRPFSSLLFFLVCSEDTEADFAVEIRFFAPWC